ncbi:MAG: hypothetical protein GPJ52_11435 [Candidatus Heimdallarchaeota archaeon]|nr:hypothetical protein [Candidatus Heimdallarchaeota archaeon]
MNAKQQEKGRKTLILFFSAVLISVLILGNHNVMSFNFGSVINSNRLATSDETLPDHLNVSTYLGGSGAEYRANAEDIGQSGMTIDSSGNIIVVGRTSSSTDFPVINAYQATFGGGSYDAFIYKLSPNGQSLIFATYFGGSGEEWAANVAVNSAGEIAVVGTTTSTDLPLQSAYQGTHNGGEFYLTDIFLAKFSSSGSLLFSTYLGGTEDDWGYGVDFDSNNKMAISGSTYSADFPIVSAYQATKTDGSTDMYVTLFAANGQSIEFSTFLGSTGNEGSICNKFDHNDDLVLTGLTGSNGFPTKDAYDSTYNYGAYDAFLAKFFSNGSLAFSTFYGGTDADRAYDLTFDENYNIIFVGSTNSFYNFPISNDAFQSSYGGGSMDGFITAFSTDGQTRVFSSFYGGSGIDEIHGVAVKDNVFAITGRTTSSNLPIEQPYQSTPVGGSSNSFVAKGFLNETVKYSTYLGGNSDDRGQKAAINSNGHIIVSGYTSSTILPTKNAYQNESGGFSDTYVTIFNLNLTVPQEIPTVSGSYIPYVPFVLVMVISVFARIKLKSKD